MAKKAADGKDKKIKESDSVKKSKLEEVTENSTLEKLTEKSESNCKAKVKKPSQTSWKWSWFGVFKFMAFAILLPPFLNFAALQQEYAGLKPPGQQYDLGWGQKLYMHCEGTGIPTVVLDAPTGVSSDIWILVQQELAKITTVCVYDRAGLGFSELTYTNLSLPEQQLKFIGQPSTVERMADDLHRLLTLINPQLKPFILVGSELGAVVARFYAQLYESDVADVVLVDPLAEDLFSQDDGIWQKFWFQHLVPVCRAHQLASAAGLTRLALQLGIMKPMSGDQIPESVIQRQKYLMCNPWHLGAVLDEHYFINNTFLQLRTLWKLKPFPSNISVTVITGNDYDEQFPSELKKAWAKAQQHLMSNIHMRSKHLVINGADHRMVYHHPQAVAKPVRLLVQQWRQKNNFIVK